MRPSYSVRPSISSSTPTSPNTPPTGRKDQLQTWVQNVSVLVRFKPREGKMGWCKVSHSLPPSSTHIHNTQPGQRSQMPRHILLLTNPFPPTPSPEHYVRFFPLTTTSTLTSSTLPLGGLLPDQSQNTCPLPPNRGLNTTPSWKPSTVQNENPSPP